MVNFDIDPAAVRGRQQRLLAEMQTQGVDLVVVNLPEHVQWLTGPYVWRLVQTSAAIWADGRVTVVAPPKKVAGAVANDVRDY